MSFKGENNAVKCPLRAHYFTSVKQGVQFLLQKNSNLLYVACLRLVICQ